MDDLKGDHIQFLGTAGSRFVVAKQERASGGVYIRYHGLSIIMDPGPGTLVRCADAGIDVTKIDAIILTHSHIDHSNDVNILIDAMTSGGIEKKGILFAPKEALDGEDRVVLNYIRPFLEDIRILEEGTKYEMGELEFSTSARHVHPVETYGIKFVFNERNISFMVDTRMDEKVIESYKSADVLIMNVTIREPSRAGWVMHLSVVEAEDIINDIQPDKVILTHFGTKMLESGPGDIAREMGERMGVRVIAAEDGMILDID